MNIFSHSAEGTIVVVFNQYLRPISDYFSDNITLQAISNE